MDNVMVPNHLLIQHKIPTLRNKVTGANESHALIEETAVLVGYEALRDLPLEDVGVEIPIETCMTLMIAGRKLAAVPILHAGSDMINGILVLVPSVKAGHIGLYRDEVTHEPHEYYCKLPSPIEECTIIVTDLILTTGGSGVSAVDPTKERGGKKTRFIAIIATPEGLKLVSYTYLRAHET